MGLCTQDYKSLCTAVTICATVVVPRCFFVYFDPFDHKKYSNPRQLLHRCQMHPRCKFGDPRSVGCRDNTGINIFYDAIKPIKVGQIDLVFGNCCGDGVGTGQGFR